MVIARLVLDSKELPFLEGIIEDVSQMGSFTLFGIKLSGSSKTSSGGNLQRFAEHPVQIQDGDHVRVYEVPGAEKEKRLSPVLGIQVLKHGKTAYKYIISSSYENKKLGWVEDFV